jgi:hypothetical protein
MQRRRRPPSDRPGGRYAWPGLDRRNRGKANERQAFLALRRGPIDPDELQKAVEQRRAQLAAAQAPAERPRGARRAQARAAPGANANLWIPIGPTVVLQGQGGGRPRVSGRVRDLQVSPDGRRAYAATANGGVWFTADGGDTWSPLGGWAVTGTPPNITGPANVLVCGCIYVRFDPGGNAANDEVLVGTGELLPQLPFGLSGTPGLQNSGVGVLRAVGPAAGAAFGQVWNLEGTNLAGRGIFRIAADPDQATPTTFVAATTSGLVMRTGAPAATWNPVPAAPFNTAAGASFICTDAIWVRGQGPTPTQLWIAVQDNAGGASGVWVSAGGTAGPFVPIALPTLAPGSRISLAAAPSDPTVVYALANGSLVWRIDNLLPTTVNQIPPNLLGGQDNYNQAIAVHPTRPERIVLGGATELADGQWSASLYLANVTSPAAGTLQFGFTSPPATPTIDDSYVGHGVHADVHVARFVPVAASTELWIGCDGGVFRSQNGDADNRLVKNSFIARNTGIASLECGYVATHPTVDGYVLAGTQDNGTLERVGDTVWQARFLGDGGGVVFNPVAPQQRIYQYIRGAWNGDSVPGYVRPVLRSTGAARTANATEQGEDGASSFYSGIDAIATGPAASRVALGTYRVWYSANFGTSWQTLPSLTDPMALGSQNPNTDPAVLTGGVPDTVNGLVIACRWASPTRLYVLCLRAVIKYDFVADATVAIGFRVAPTVLTRRTPEKCEDPQGAAQVVSPGQLLPAAGAWSDIAVHDPNRGPHGSFYVAGTGHPNTPAMDTLWWFDGNNRWHATGLRNLPNGILAPAYAVVVDPLLTNDVYVATAVGVWKGTFDQSGPAWSWQVFSNGLPEAAVHDLTIFRSGGVRLLRAAVAARGVWEVDLVSPAAPQTFVRVHTYDTRRHATVTLTDPAQAVPNTALSWHASPDVRVRPARGSRPPKPTGLPWVGNSPDAYALWVFQTALHGRPDLLCRPTSQWTPLFDARLRAATGGSNRITRTLWNTIVGSGSSFPNAYADPWDGAQPTEADLLELITDLPLPVGSAGSMAIRRVRARVDVLVHHRHLTPVNAADVKVTLTMRKVTGTQPLAWSVLAGGWAAPVQTFLRTGGAAPALPDGWTFADAATPVRSPSASIDARLPRSVTFEVDLRGFDAGDRILLVAVVHSTPDPVTLPNQTLETLVRTTRFAAVRSVEIV